MLKLGKSQANWEELVTVQFNVKTQRMACHFAFFGDFLNTGESFMKMHYKGYAIDESVTNALI